MTTPDSTFDVWERREEKIYRVVPYVALCLATIMALLTPSISRVPSPAILGLALAAGAWLLWVVTVSPACVRRPATVGTYYAGLLLLSGALVVANPLFGFFAWVGYLHAFMLRGPWRYVGVLLTAATIAASQVGGVPEPTLAGIAVYLLLVAVNGGLAGTFTFFGWTVSAQNQKRKAMIVELAEAKGQLEASLQENAELHAQLVAQAREAGVTDERQRMSREIHDTLAQGLAGIITQLQAAEQARDHPGEWQRHLDNAARLARESLSDARRSVRAVRPEPLESARLPEALGQVTHQWSTMSGVAAEVTTTGAVRPLHVEIEAALLRTAQEALANVAKHAGASRVGLTLSYMEDLVTLDVRDDGVGFDVAGLPVNGRADSGYGLPGMRQRLYRLAGTLAVESEPGTGTAISAAVPAIGPEAAGE